VRTIFWTEKSYNGPRVTIPSGRIVTVNPIYSNVFLETVPTEYVVVGSSNADPNAEATQVLRTLWYEKSNGIGELHAYNQVGRILVEYLGALREDGTHEFLGADIVEIRRSAEVETLVTPLGEQLRPREGPKENGDDQMSPALPSMATAVTGKPLYGTFIRPDGITEYYAERENLNPDNMVLYWMAKFDASLHAVSGGDIAGLDISWPVAKRSYLHQWPDSPTEYEPVNVSQTGADATLGPKFAAVSLPSLVFQDDPAEL
jgi:hypothetical protein